MKREAIKIKQILVLVIALFFMVISCVAGAEPSKPAFKPMKLTVSAGGAPGHPINAGWVKMMDYITEATNGAVNFKVFWGNTLTSSMEELMLMKDGGVDHIMCMTMAYGDSLPMFFIPSSYVGTPQEAKAYWDEIFYKNPKTSAIMDRMFARYNAKVLGFWYVGGNGAFAKKPWSGIKDLKGLKIASQEAAFLTHMGLNSVFVDVADEYDSLDRGVVDAGVFAFEGYVALKFYEPAPHFMFDGGVCWGMPFTIRLDLWESWPRELQQVWLDAIDYIGKYSIDFIQENKERLVAVVEETGGSVGTLSQEDARTWNEAQIVASVELGLKRGKEQDCYDDMVTVMKAACEFLEYEWRW